MEVWITIAIALPLLAFTSYLAITGYSKGVRDGIIAEKRRQSMLKVEARRRRVREKISDE